MTLMQFVNATHLLRLNNAISLTTSPPRLNASLDAGADVFTR